MFQSRTSPASFAPRRASLSSPSRRAVLGGLLAAPFVARARPALAAPLRIASLDYALAEQLVVLGAPPIAVVDAGEWSHWVGEPKLPAGIVDIGTGLAPNVELLAALRPDLVLSTDFTAMTEAQVSRVAPVEHFAIYSEGGSPLPKAMDAMRRLGGLVGREAEAAAYLDDTERFFSACAERARPFRDRPILFLSFVDPRHVRVYSRPGMQQDVFDRLGLRNAWEGEGIYWGFATTGIERLAEVGEAILVVDYLPPDVQRRLEQSPLWRALPLRRGAGPIPVLPTVSAFGGVPSARRLAGLLLDNLERQNA